jgi:selenocysteine lyase/cysteine desulfurase
MRSPVTGDPARLDHMMGSRKGEFSLPANYHYLNSAYMSPLSRRVQAAGETGIRRAAVPADIQTEDFFSGCDRVRELFARLINASDPRRIAIIPSASYGLSVVARNTPVERGQNVVTVHHQFPSNVHVWRRSCESVGAELRIVCSPIDGPGGARAWNDAILEAIDGDTAVVAQGVVHWTDGTPFDVEVIAARARDMGAAFILDATQAVGAMPFDVQRVRPDALICAAYKWLTGPYSIGAAYFASRYDDGTPLEETWMGRVGSEDFAGLVEQSELYRPGALRYDMGEAANFILVPMFIEALEQLLEWGVENIQAYCRELTRGLIEEIVGEQDPEGPEPVGHLFGLHVPAGVDPEALRARLSARNVFVSVRGDAIRVAPHIFNDAADIEALRGVLAESGMLAHVAR